MSDIKLRDSYESYVDNVHNLFDTPGEGFLVPLYQRKYTWEEENITQLFEDLLLGVWELSNEDGHNAATFLGTVILASLSDETTSVQKGESHAQPTVVRFIIDGQQRISTIALLAIQITERLKSLGKKLPKKAPYRTLQKHCENLNKELLKLYTVGIGRESIPPGKPKIICAEKDLWTEDDDSYSSPVAHYIATYISKGDSEEALKAIDSVEGARVCRNIKLINQWLDAICGIQVPNESLSHRFPTGNRIISDRVLGYIFNSGEENLKRIISKAEINKEKGNFIVAIYHICLLTYYLLFRCAVNRLQPEHEKWGFDMFQALNATGTPLTAMETFLPQIIQFEKKSGNHKWEKTLSFTYMQGINELFKTTTKNKQKNTRTNDLLRTFALCYEVKELSDDFSAQRLWIAGVYEKDLSTLDEKHNFLSKLAQTAKFFYSAWYMEKVNKNNCIDGLESHQEGDLASLLVRYLRNASSKLSVPILARFYGQALENKACMDDFVEAVKACAAFFTLWRSARSTSGLPDVYRRFFKEHNWKMQPGQISSKTLKKYFLGVLNDYEIDEKPEWITASKRFLFYNSEIKTICRFVLFLAGHDRVADDDKPGLTVIGASGVCPLLSFDQWVGRDYKSLEHIAPQQPPENHTWDPNIYTENRVDELGNILLLATTVNNLVDNKNWDIKFPYYSCVGTPEKEKIDKLIKKVEKKGFNKNAIKKLSRSRYAGVVTPILKVGIGGSWDANIIDRRTQQIKDIAWEKLMSWLRDN